VKLLFRQLVAQFYGVGKPRTVVRRSSGRSNRFSEENWPALF